MTKWEQFLRIVENIRRIVWNKHIKLWWYKLWIRRNEFHVSFDTDAEALAVMDDNERRDYCQDLARRRTIAHERALARRNV